MLDINVAGPSDGVANHEPPHHSRVVATDAEEAHSALVTAIPTPQCTHYESLHRDCVSLVRQLVHDRLVFFQLLAAGPVERFAAIFEGDTHVDDGDTAVDFVVNDDVRS